MPIAEPKNELKHWINPFESIWNKNPNQKLLFSCNPIQITKPKNVLKRHWKEANKHVIPIPIEVLQKKKQPWDSPKHFWLEFFFGGGLLVYIP